MIVAELRRRRIIYSYQLLVKNSSRKISNYVGQIPFSRKYFSEIDFALKNRKRAITIYNYAK